MKLRQLQYVSEIVRQGMNITAAADCLYTSQPGISSQIKRLEDELGFAIFVRRGKQLTELSEGGRAMIASVERILHEVDNIHRIADDIRAPASGNLVIATTHTQARYALPEIIKEFSNRYPGVSLHLHQGTPTQIAEMTATGEADIGIATEALYLFDDLVLLPCYRWNRCVLTPKDHPLANDRRLSLKAIAQYPVITYVFGIADRSVINRAFAEQDLDLNVVLTAADAEVIKTYVRTGLGIGIVARMAYDPAQDGDLAVLDAGHLFEPSVTSLAIRHNAWLRNYVYDFIQLFAPHLTHDVITELQATADKSRQEELFEKCVAHAELR